jgi:hypothetical protein
MNRITRIAAIALSFAATSAFADDITIDTAAHQSLKSRAEVQAELAQYEATKVNLWSTSYNILTGFKSQTTRADVMAQVKAAQATGELAAMGAEDSGSAYLAQHRGQAVAGTVVASR